jgi:predicted component of type VI protein secretion system
MKSIGVFALVLMVFLCVTFVACGSGKKKAKPEPTTVTTTLGQELQDLNKAYKDGIITEKEYEKAKKALIEKRTE